MSSLFSCIVGPRLYKIYDRVGNLIESQPYVPNALEKIGNKIVQGLRILYNVGIYTSPFIVLSLYRGDYALYMSAVKYGTGLGLLLIVALICRGAGRRLNPTYTSFLDTLSKSAITQRPNEEIMGEIRKYEFDFASWPTNFDWTDLDADSKKPRVFVERGAIRQKQGIISRICMVPCQIVAWVLTFLVGKQLVYPGCIQLLQLALDQYLVNGREKLIHEHGGQRNKIISQDGNTIDTMLIDRRKKGIYPNGKTLVVCCEGNAGFYEVGIMATPLQLGYSVLGWNHPGFAASTGAPYPDQEQNAVDAVMQFAIHGLGFREEDILVYGWSIGGYTSTWAAMNYPQISGLILDATFDDILPLALPRMPACMGPIVKTAIRNHINLIPGDQLCRYHGPVTIIRRLRDEIITTDETQLKNNCGNDLLMKLLRTRYPGLWCTQSSEVLLQWLSEDPSLQGSIMSKWNVDVDICSTLLSTYIQENSESYPMMIGDDMTEDDKTKLILYLASKYMIDFNSSHNNPLDPSYFRKPWRLITDSSYVQVD
ncbi:Protein abhd16a [Halocaridina rubra]|uniref:Protein abhd16a n=1 Tax=Halocaridina rubra TaxID=373956 RepID=A0AAN9A4P8_HALRR